MSARDAMRPGPATSGIGGVMLSRRVFLRGGAVAGVLAWAGQTVAAEPALPALAFATGRDVTAGQTELRARLRSILALPASAVPLHVHLGQTAAVLGHTRTPLRFTAEAGETVPGLLLRPANVRGRLPVMICLQGHSPGMHLSLGEARNDAERELIAGGRDLALQAVSRGWAALVIEQRAFGERACPGLTCNDAALHALHRGRPLTGQRVWDVMRAVDFIATQPDLDSGRIGCLGNSTGGTVSFYAACVEARIALAVVSCAFCTFEDSWLSLPHCACGYLPGIAAVADMPDLAGLIAPRRLLIVAGKEDNLARLSGVERGVARAREIFTAADAADRLAFVVGDGGHRFYPEQAWPVIAQMTAGLPRSS